MKKNILISMLVAGLAILAVVVVKQKQEIALLEARSERTFAALAEEKAKATSIPAAVVEAPAPLPESKPVEPVAAPAPVAQAEPGTGSTSNYMAGLSTMMKSPQMKEMMRAQQKVMVDQQYGSLSKYVNLSAEKQDALKSLLSDRQMALMDAGMSMMSGTDAEKKQGMEDAKTVKADYDQKIKDLLGPQDYQTFQDYEKTVGERVQVQMFKASLPSDAVLTDQQEYNLIAAMYEERTTLPATSLLSKGGQNADPSQFTEEAMAETLKQMEQLQKRYADRAAAILTPAQLTQFTQWQQQMSTMQIAGWKMATQMFGQGKSGSTPNPTH